MMMNKRLPLELVGLFPNKRELSTCSIGSKEFSVIVSSRFSLLSLLFLLKFFSHCWRDQYGFTGASLFLLL